MALVSVRVCDTCGSQEGVHTYDVKRDDRKKKKDLCTEHGAPLEQFLEEEEAPRRAGRPRTRAAGSKATTMEEIEALKQQ